MYSTVQASSI